MWLAVRAVLLLHRRSDASFVLFFFNDTATTEIYTLSLHDALPISASSRLSGARRGSPRATPCSPPDPWRSLSRLSRRSEEHTSELQSPCNLVCRLLLEKKKKDALEPHTGKLVHDMQGFDRVLKIHQ